LHLACFIRWKVEQYVLPTGFGDRFKKALFNTVSSTKCINEVEEIELFIEGVANSCRRQAKDALEVIFDCCSKNQEGMVNLNHLIELCYSLSVAASILVSKRIDQKRIQSFLQDMPSLQGLKNSLSRVATDKRGNVAKESFVEWGRKTVPFLYSCLSTFTHNLIFHGKSTKSHHHESYFHPELLDCSDIFNEKNPSLPFTIGCMAPGMGGKVSL
jgi:Ca2+-binding EF-hand superfamily protein